MQQKASQTAATSLLQGDVHLYVCCRYAFKHPHMTPTLGPFQECCGAQHQSAASLQLRSTEQDTSHESMAEQHCILLAQPFHLQLLQGWQRPLALLLPAPQHARAFIPKANYCSCCTMAYSQHNATYHTAELGCSNWTSNTARLWHMAVVSTHVAEMKCQGKIGQ